MPLTTQVLFGLPQCEIAAIIQDRLARCHSTSIVSGFVTVAGVKAISAPIRAIPTKLATLLVGAGTYGAFEALDGLVAAGVPANRLFVHLGHSSIGSGKSFCKYRPMLHSKIYLMENPDGTSCAFVGSHNLTDFAMNGKNGEAGVLIEGPSSDPQFETIRRHIAEARRQAVAYLPTMKAALNWWTVQFIEGFRAEVKDAPREVTGTRTIVALAARADGPLPGIDDIIYFELPTDLGKINSLTTEVHIYIFPESPATFATGLEALDQARSGLVCRTTGLELEEGGTELKADWILDGKADPLLSRAPNPLRPIPSPGVKQIRVKVVRHTEHEFDYLFENPKQSWEPAFEERAFPVLSGGREENGKVSNRQWALVKGLTEAGLTEHMALGQLLVEGIAGRGSYVGILLRRRKVIPLLETTIDDPLLEQLEDDAEQ